MRCPAALEALAWASWLASAREKVMSGSLTMVNPSRPSAKRPMGVIQSARRSSARMSTRPEPQMPCGSTSPMTSMAKPPSSMRTFSMAPSAPGMP